MTISRYLFILMGFGLLLSFVGQVQASDTCVLTSTSSAGALPKDYPRTNFRISLRVNYTQPGTVLDTVGINAAPAGSFALAINSEGKPVLVCMNLAKRALYECLMDGIFLLQILPFHQIPM